MKDLILKLKMIAENQQFNKSVAESNRELHKMTGTAKAVSEAIDGTKASADHASNALKGLVSAATLAAFAAITKDAIDANAELTKLATSLDMSREALGLWQIIGKDAGVEIGDAFKDLQEKIGEFAATGGGEGVDVFKQLKLDVNELINLEADQQLLKIAGALDKIKDISQGEKTFLLESLMNDGSKLLPYLEDNAKRLREIEQLANINGAIISPEQQAVLQAANHELKLLGMQADGLKNQVGALGAEIVTVFGDDAQAVMQWLGDAIFAVEQDIRSLLLAWEYAAGAMGDTGRAEANDIGVAFDDALSLIRSGWLDMPVYARVAFEQADAYGQAWGASANATFNDFRGATATALAYVVEAAIPAFGGLADIGGKSIAFIIGRLADLAGSAASVAATLSSVLGTDIGAGVAGVEARLRAMADNATNAGKSLKEGMGEAVISLKNVAADSEKAAAKSRLLSSEMKVQAVESANAAAKFIELNQAKRSQASIDRQIKRENAELGGLASVIDRVADSNRKGRVNHEAVKKALEEETEASKAAKKEKSDLQKEAERLAKQRQQEADQLKKAQDDEIASQKAKALQLTLTEQAYYASQLQAKGFTDAIRAEAEALNYSNTLLEARKSLADEAASIQLNPVQQYARELERKGVKPDDAALLVDEKRSLIAEKLTKEAANRLQQETLTTNQARLQVLMGKEGLTLAEAQNVLAVEQQGNFSSLLCAADDQYKKATLTTAQYREQVLQQTELLTVEQRKQLLQAESRAAFAEVTTELDKQARLIGASAEEQRAIELEQKGLTADQINYTLWRERSLQTARQELQVIGDIRDGLQGAIQAALRGDGFDFGSIADGLQKSFENRVFKAAFDADFGNANSLQELVAGFGKNSFGQNIAGYAQQMGVGGFGGAGQYANWQYGAAAVGGNAVGGLLGGAGGAQYGTLGASIGMAVAGPIGAVVGTVLGGIAGGLTAKYEKTGQGIRLGYVGGEAAGNNYTEETKDGGLIGGKKKRKRFEGLDSALQDRLDAYFDEVETSLVAQADKLQSIGVGGGSEAAQAIIDGFGQGTAQGLQQVAQQAAAAGSGITGQMIAGLLSSVTGLSEDAKAKAEASFATIDLTGKTDAQAQALIQEWADGITDNLYQEAFGKDFATLTSLSNTGETTTQTVGRLVAQMDVMQGIVTAVGGEFDAAGIGILTASDAIAELFGGLDKFTAATSFFYEQFFTEEERKQSLLDKAKTETAKYNAELASLGFGAVSSRDDLRRLVAGLDETTEAGQQGYLVAMQLAQSLDVVIDAQEDAIKAAEAQAKANKQLARDIADLADDLFANGNDSKLAAYESQIQQEQARIADLNQAIQDRYQQELANYDSLQSIAGEIGDYLQSLQLSDLSTLNPADKLAEAERQYQDTLKAAKAGDAEAAGKLQQAANDYLTIARDYFASGDSYTQAFTTVNSDLSGVELAIKAMPKPTQPAEVVSLIIPKLEQGIKAIEAQEEALRQLDIAEDLKGKLAELSLATGQDIASLAKQFGVSLEDLANRLGVSLASLQALGASQQKPTQTPAPTATQTTPTTVPTGKTASNGKPIGQIVVGSAYNAANTAKYNAVVSSVEKFLGGKIPKNLAGADFNAFASASAQHKTSLSDLADYLRKALGHTGKITAPNGNSYAVGSDYIQGDQVAQIHNSEMIFTARQSASIRDNVVSALSGLAKVGAAIQGAKASSTARLEALIERLIEDNRMLRAEVAAMRNDGNANADAVVDVLAESGQQLQRLVVNSIRPVQLKGAA